MELLKDDNLQLAQAILSTLAPLPPTGRIPTAALVDLRYRVVGELVGVEAVLGRARGGG